VALSALPKMSIINAANHALSFFSGTALEATLDTAEQELEAGRRVRVRGFRPLTDASTVYGSIGARETTQAAASYSEEQLVTGSGRCPANVSTRLARACASRRRRHGASPMGSSRTSSRKACVDARSVARPGRDRHVQDRLGHPLAIGKDHPGP
jgi:hypothetical protein